MNVIGWAFTDIAIVAVSLKLFARIVSKRFGWDDYFIFFIDGKEHSQMFLGKTDTMDIVIWLSASLPW